MRPHRPSSLRLPPVLLPVWVATLTISLFGLAMPLVMLQIFDRIIPFEAYDTLTMLLVGMGVVTALEAVQRVLRATLLNHQAARFAVETGHRATHRLLNADERDSALGTTRAAGLLTAGTAVRDYLCGTGRLFLVEMPFCFLALVLIWLLAGYLVLIPLIGIAVMFAAAWGVRWLQRRLIANRRAADDRRYGMFEQMIALISIAKANQMELGLLNRYQGEQRASAAAGRLALVSANMCQSLAQTISMSFSAAIVLAGALLVIDGSIGAAELAACTMLNGRAAQPLLQAAQHWASGESVGHAVRALEEGLALPQAPALPTDLYPGAVPSLVFQGVTVRASRSGRALLRNFDMTAGPGLTALGSPTVASVDAVFQSALAELAVDKGSVRVCGRPAAVMMRYRGAGQLVYLDSDVAVFEGSLIFNIALSHAPERVDAAYAAAAALGLEADVNKLPNGFDTDLRDSGLQVASRGFLQRMNLARALSRDPRILLLNDGLNAMDQSALRTAGEALQARAANAVILAYDSTGIVERYADRRCAISSPNAREAEKSARKSALSPALAA